MRRERKLKECYYFSHDSNAKDDPKCVMLIEQLGLEGYGIYWILIETLREQPTFKYPLSAVSALARRYCTSAEKMKTVIVNFKLFEVDEDDFFSISLLKRMDKVETMRQQRIAAGKASGEKRKLLSERALNEKRTSVEQLKESKVKENKINESKVKDINSPIPPLLDNDNCQSVVDEYNSTCVKMPTALTLNDSRKSAIKSRIKKYGREAITTVFRYASQEKFYNGDNDRGWRADFDWLIGPKNFVRMLERAKSGFTQRQKKSAAQRFMECDDIEPGRNETDIDIHSERIF